MVALVIAGTVLAQEAKPVGLQLTPKLRLLLVQEMRLVLSAQQVILSALVTGNHAVVAAQAERIHDSFILQQSLTEQDKQDLMAAVPPSFVKLDRSFHELAENLAEAARDQTAKQAALYFNDTNL
jgi:hypothetical protein